MAKYCENLKYHEDTTKKHDITKEEREFLACLQKELNTQDDFGQADPKFWVIKGSEKIYHVQEADGFELYDEESCEMLASNIKEICEYINSHLLEEINEDIPEKEQIVVTCEESIFGEDTIVVRWKDCYGDEEERVLDDLHDIQEWLEGYGYDYKFVSYKIVPKIYGNTLFLTYADAEKHLKENDYHYSEDAHPYAMTAWRSPRMEKLIAILRKVDWTNEM